MSESKEKLKKLLYCCDSLHDDYVNSNYGDAQEWLRHIAKAYGEWEDAVDQENEE